jgi:hypothetical protein
MTEIVSAKQHAQFVASRSRRGTIGRRRDRRVVRQKPTGLLGPWKSRGCDSVNFDGHTAFRGSFRQRRLRLEVIDADVAGGIHGMNGLEGVMVS